jgi:hypothetical protein
MKTSLKLFFSNFLFFMFISMNGQSSSDVPKSISSIKLIDNKGTIKYLQSNNGITQIVNSVNDKTTTTWQLGGKLLENTYIDVNGKHFALDKLSLETGNPSTDAVSGSIHGVGTGWTLLVRDESTGEIKKKLAVDFITSGHIIYTSTSSDVTNNKVELTPAGLSQDIFKILVYRNGVKLIAGNDYTLSSGKIIITSPTVGNIWNVNLDDMYEAHWIN